jgi:hypothetical protein
MDPLWKHQAVLRGITAERMGNGISSRAGMLSMFSYHPLLQHPGKLAVGEKAPPEVEEAEEEEGEEGAKIIGLVTQMSHHYHRNQLATTHMIVQVRQIAVTTPACMV